MQFKKFKKPYLIAEIGNNHEGNYKLAIKLVKLAKNSGADAVKFQTYITENFINPKEIKRFKKLKKFELTFSEFKKIFTYCKKIKIDCFSTPFDEKSAIFLNKHQKKFKISSGDNNFDHLIKLIASFNKTIILSTGLSNINSLKKTINLINKIWKSKKKNKKELIILHCVSSYPVSKQEANIGAIPSLQKKFPNCTIGYSDHTIGNEAAILAATLGAKVIEKHFTLDNNFSNFRDHKLSANPKSLKELNQKLINVSILLGNSIKKIEKSEKNNLISMRRSIVAKKDIPKNSKIKYSDLKWTRPGDGITANQNYKVVGKKTKKKIRTNEKLLQKYLVS